MYIYICTSITVLDKGKRQRKTCGPRRQTTRAQQIICPSCLLLHCGICCPAASLNPPRCRCCTHGSLIWGMPVQVAVVVPVVMIFIGSFESILAVDMIFYSLSLLLEIASLIYLRIQRPDMHRGYKIPLGEAGLIAMFTPTALLCLYIVLTAKFDQLIVCPLPPFTPACCVCSGVGGAFASRGALESHSQISAGQSHESHGKCCVGTARSFPRLSLTCLDTRRCPAYCLRRACC